MYVHLHNQAKSYFLKVLCLRLQSVVLRYFSIIFYFPLFIIIMQIRVSVSVTQ